jgi:hypothetical protein
MVWEGIAEQLGYLELLNYLIGVASVHRRPRLRIR